MYKDCKQNWWKEARFGMFIHWGLFSQLAGEWQGRKTKLVGEFIFKELNIPLKEYEKVAEDFNPVDFSAEACVKLAKEAGMKYLVFTAKQHDGFAMYHSKCSKFNIVDATPFKRDPLKELAEACQKEGVKFCFYYSQTQDWHDPNGYEGYYAGQIPDDKKDFRKYMNEKCKPQLYELLTGYGDIGLIWFDTPLSMPAEYSREIFEFVKSIQPKCIINGRIGNQLGEYVSTGDNFIPALPYPGDWEIPASLNDSWGYRYFDDHWKDAEKVIKLLVKINSRGGNYLLNIGPDGKGNIPAPSVEILKKVGKWMSVNGESIYGTKAVPVFPYDYDWGMFTYKENKLYMHVFDWDHLVRHPIIQGIRNKITRAYFLKTGVNIGIRQTYDSSIKRSTTWLELPDCKPGEIYTVICLETEGNEILLDSLEDL